MNLHNLFHVYDTCIIYPFKPVFLYITVTCLSAYLYLALWTICYIYIYLESSWKFIHSLVLMHDTYKQISSFCLPCVILSVWVLNTGISLFFYSAWVNERKVVKRSENINTEASANCFKRHPRRYPNTHLLSVFPWGLKSICYKMYYWLLCAAVWCLEPEPVQW